MPLLNRLFGRSESSGQVAKERLRKVLVQDRANVSPQFMEAMRVNLTQVLSEYMDVDEGKSEISITSSDRNVALVANIPIRRMKRGNGKKAAR
ncbi:MAG TPA: cell division topological specificity factor MinE [Armatimonadota bacterium]|nr:cell division topological specificity factor MinE [Armatimonadota bacterium]